MQARQSEIDKYVKCYRNPKYKMGAKRNAHAVWALDRLPRGSLLDVSTGRGEMMREARKMGFAPVMGTEAVPYLCDGRKVVQALGHDLPFADGQFDYVTMFDVMEHLLPEDTGAVCRELKRVASKRVIVTVCNQPSQFGGGKVPLHINLRDSYEVWHEELAEHFGAKVNRLDRRGSISEMFEVVL
jgi:ubiquinone/menaquinone biosynthesis C-methylase UbiE